MNNVNIIKVKKENAYVMCFSHTLLVAPAEGLASLGIARVPQVYQRV